MSLFLFGSLILASVYAEAAQTRGAAPSTSAKRTVCTVTVNSDDEKKAFQAKLSPKDFKFVELTDIGRTPGQPNADWFKKACEQKVSCDVLIVSGHFAGSFFGDGQEEWSLDEMERMSCSNKCAGILQNPKETFLFGCNTLATKEKDSRRPEDYQATLQGEHYGFSEATATRLRQTRYSALGASYKERMQRVFAGVPHLYGFDSVGPLGAVVKPSLDAYLAKIPNYSAYLDRIKKTEGERLSEQLTTLNAAVGNMNDTVMIEPNTELARAMKPYGNFAQCAGVMPGTLDANIRAEVCRLYNKTLPLAERARSAAEMLRKRDRLAYLPSVFEFMKENETALNRDPQAREILKGLQGDAALWAELDRMLADNNESPYTKIDILRLKYSIGKLDKSGLEGQLKTVLAKEIRALDKRAVEILCTLRKEHGVRVKVGARDIDLEKMKSNNGVAAFSCLATDDVAITAQAISTFRAIDTSKSERARFGLEALMALPSYEAERAQEARRFVGSSVPRLNAYAHMLGASTAETPQERSRLLSNLLTLPDWAQEDAYNAFAASGAKNEALARDMVAMLNEGTDDSYYSRLQAIARIAPANSPVWNEFVDTIDSGGEDAAASAAAFFKDLPQPPTTLAPWAVQKMTEFPKRRSYFAALLANTDLTPTQVSDLANQMTSTRDPELQQSLRYILRNQRNATLTPAQRQAMQGRYAEVDCDLSSSGDYTCREMVRN